MAGESPITDISGWNRWRQLTIALLVGMGVFSVMVYMVAVVQTPVVPPPIRLAPIFVFVTALSAVAVLLIWWDNPFGYGTSAIAGVLAVVGTGLFLLGSLGPTNISPIPIGYALLGIGLLISTGKAWRNRSAPVATQPPETPAE